MIKNIIFDLCGVLIDWNPRYLYRKIFKDADEMESFLTDIVNRDFLRRYDMGEEPGIIVGELAEKYPHYRSEIEASDKRWHEMIGGRIEKTYRIVDDLKGRGYEIFGLTNFPISKLREIDPRYLYAIPPENNMISATEKICKPDRRLYEQMLRRYRLNPRECLFIDNHKPYVDAAMAVGIRGLHFTAPEKLLEDLKSLTIL